MGSENVTSMQIVIPEIGLTEIDGEPRARDIEIAERLGMSRPRNIRNLIERNIGELESFGPALRREALAERPQGGGNASLEYWLNEEQALLVSVLSGAPNAPAVRAMLIRTFVAWRRGHLVEPSPLTADGRAVIGGIVKSVVHRQVQEVLPALVERALLESGHVVSTEYKPALAVLTEMGVPPKRRRAFSQKVSRRLLRYSIERGAPVRTSRETGRYLFHIDAVRDWRALEGNALVADHKAALAGQGVLRLVPSR